MASVELKEKRLELKRIQREIAALEKRAKSELKVGSRPIKVLAKEVNRLALRHYMDQKAVLNVLQQTLELASLGNVAKLERGDVNSHRVVAPKYRHPEIEEKTWTGRGIAPRWVQDWEAQGHTREELLIGQTQSKVASIVQPAE